MGRLITLPLPQEKRVDIELNERTHIDGTSFVNKTQIHLFRQGKRAMTHRLLTVLQGDPNQSLLQGDPNQNFCFQMTITLKLSTSDPTLVKPKWV